jgi:lysozyme
MSYNLRKGDRGQEVSRLQKHLCGLTIDGIFGSKTDQAVRDYQAKQGLIVDGIAGTNTLRELGIPVLLGIDVSAWNGNINWGEVSKSGVKYVWVKHTEGQTHVNSGHKENMLGARNNNVIAGAYHFGRPDTNRDENLQDAVREAEWFLKNYNHKTGDLIPVLDVEKGMKTDDNYNVEWSLKWLEVVENALGCKPMVYTAKWAEDLYLIRADKSLLAELAKYPVWWASYNDGVEPERWTGKIWKEWDVWQFTGSGSTDGIVGRCDRNWMAGGQLDSLRIK